MSLGPESDKQIHSELRRDANSPPIQPIEPMEPEGATFLESLGPVRGDFELERAKNAYIPLLRASYDLAHGNENPDFPPGYEVLAKIRTSHAEMPESVQALGAEAMASLQNDIRALEMERPAGAAEALMEGIASPDAFGFVMREQATGSVLVTIRGTQTPEEWLKNFTAIPNPFSAVPGFGLVHLGFETMWGRIRTPVLDELKKLPADTRVTFVGHSLGGAMATLGTVDAKRNLNLTNVDLFTVGCPRVGQVRFRIHFNRLIEKAYRVTEQRDIVPHVPPIFLLWNHVGQHIGVRSTVSNAHSLDSYLQGLENLGPALESLDGRGQVLATWML